MNKIEMIHRTLTLTAGMLVLATATVAGAFQQAQPPQEDNKDPRYYVHVSGITCPTCLTNVVKQLNQVSGVQQVKVIDFKKGVFAVTPSRGTTLSENALRASVQRSGFTLRRFVVPTKAAPKLTPPSPASEKPVPAEIQKLLVGPQDAFLKGDFDAALKGVLDAAQKKPKDATVQQFVSLVDFALSNYGDASTAAHAALYNGPHWNWKQLRGHYAKTEVYTLQLRKLEKFVREHPTSTESRFLLAYHYLMLGQSQAADSHLKRVAEQNPDDKLVRQLLEPQKQEVSKAP